MGGPIPNPLDDPLGFLVPGLPGSSSDPVKMLQGAVSPKVPILPAVPPPAGMGDAEVEAARRAQLALFAAQGAGSTLLTGPGGDNSATLGSKTLLGA